MAKVAVSPAVMDLLHTHSLFTETVQGDRWKVGQIIHVDPDAAIEPYAHIFEGANLPRAMGAFSYSFGVCDTKMSIGRYSSLSWRIEPMGSKHPTDWVTTSPMSHNPRPLRGFSAYARDTQTSFPIWSFDQGPQHINIGHDVWIGASAMLRRGITIGDGAIVGARSVVTHDVPPYAIVAGVPARIVRYRFSDTLIERLQAAAWWQFGPDVLQPLDVREPESFLDRLEAAVGAGAKPLDLPLLTGAEIIAAGGVVV